MDLVVTGDPTRATPDRLGGTPGLVIGERGSLRLPGDEVLLADVVHAVAMGQHLGRSRGVLSCDAVPDPGPGRARDAEAGRGLVVAVAGWQGGVGTSTLVRALALHAGAVAVDATGAGPGLVPPGEERTPGVRWADLRVSEPSLPPDLVARLPVIGGRPALVADRRGGATPSDPRLAPVLRHLSHACDVVVDLGRWDGRGAALTGLSPSGGAPAVPGGVDVVCLVGGGDDESVVRLAGALGVWPPLCPLVVAHTRRAPSPLLGRAAGEWERGTVVTWHFGRGTRGRRRRLSLLWSRMRGLVLQGRAWSGGTARTGDEGLTRSGERVRDAGGPGGRGGVSDVGGHDVGPVSGAGQGGLS
ncbi:MAG: hypothetical protein ACTJGR_01835 [Pauljensenia sp.]